MDQVKHPLAAGPLLESDPLTDVAVAIEVMVGEKSQILDLVVLLHNIT